MREVPGDVDALSRFAAERPGKQRVHALRKPFEWSKVAMLGSRMWSTDAKRCHRVCRASKGMRAAGSDSCPEARQSTRGRNEWTTSYATTDVHADE